jgi:hypothetical protein
VWARKNGHFSIQQIRSNCSGDRFEMRDCPVAPDGSENLLKNGSKELSCCVVWTSIPLISWVIPAIGHVGICNSSGTLFDFQGDGMIGRDNMLFGEPMQKWRVPIEPAILDRAVDDVSSEFRHVGYSFFCSNCHFFVASCLQQAGLPGPCCGSDWRTGATVKIIYSLILKGRSISACKFVAIWVPFLIIVGLIVLLVWLTNR